MGGNVFGNTKEIYKDNINPTLDIYFDCLCLMFPDKGDIFNMNTFTAVGSVGKKDFSGDIDLAIDSNDIIPFWTDEECKKWRTTLDEVNQLSETLLKRAKTATTEETMIRALLIKISEIINKEKLILVHEKKITSGNMFTSAVQYDSEYHDLDKSVQIDWMIGDKELLMFSYYSDSYDKNIKGLHRTQSILAMFLVCGYTFNHTKGLTRKSDGVRVASKPKEMLEILSKELNQHIDIEIVKNYHSLMKIFRQTDKFNDWEQAFFKIMDSTRCDIPYDLQEDWIARKDELGLTGKFLPEDSNLIKYTN